MIAKPKSEALINILDWKCTIMLNPRQKWNYTVDYMNYYIVERDHVSIAMAPDEFDRFFRKIET